MQETLPGRGWELHYLILADGQILDGIASGGAKSEIDEAIAQTGLDALFKK
jgi:glc operon protein GlcG